MKRVGSGRDTIELDNGKTQEQLPIVGGLTYFNYPSPYYGERVKFTDIKEVITTGEGSLYFSSLFVTLLMLS